MRTDRRRLVSVGIGLLRLRTMMYAVSGGSIGDLLSAFDTSIAMPTYVHTQTRVPLAKRRKMMRFVYMGPCATGAKRWGNDALTHT